MNGPAIMASLAERFARACGARGEQRVSFRVGGHHVAMRFAGEAFTGEVLPAMRHLVAEPEAQADLTLHFWDEASTGVGIIPFPWPSKVGWGNVVLGAQEDGLRATYRADNGLVTILDAAQGVGFVWMKDARATDRHDRAAPLRSLFAAYFAPRGMAVTHGAAMGRDGRGILLGGRGGSGKSTTSLLCLEAGLDFVGDDYLLVDPLRPFVHSLYATGKVLPESQVRMPQLGGMFEAAAEGVDAGDKAIVYLYPQMAAQLSQGLEIAALMLPTVTGRRDTTAVPITGMAALRGLAPSTVFQNGDEAQRTLMLLAKLASRVPCYRLELGLELSQIPEVIAGLVGGTAARAVEGG